MGHLIDTSVAIAVRDADIRIRNFLAALPAAPAISIITLVELEGGIRESVPDELSRRRAVDTMVELMNVLEFGKREAAVYGAIVRAIGFARSKVIDRMIAAQAMAVDAVLVTLNPRDVRNIPGLMYEDWTAPPQ